MVYQQSVKYHENRHTKQACRSIHGLSTKCEIPWKQTHKTDLQIYTWFINKVWNTMKTDTQNRLADLYMVYQETIEHHENRHTKQTCRSTHGLSTKCEIPWKQTHKTGLQIYTWFIKKLLNTMKTDTQNRLADLHMVYQQSVKYHENRHTKQACRSIHGLSTKCEIPWKQTHKTDLQIYTWFINKVWNTMKTDTQNRLADLYMVYQETIEHHENRHTKQTCRATHGLLKKTIKHHENRHTKQTCRSIHGLSRNYWTPWKQTHKTDLQIYTWFTMKTDTQNRLADLHMVYQKTIKHHENTHTKQTCRSIHGLSTNYGIPWKQTHKTDLQIYTWLITKLWNTINNEKPITKLWNTINNKNQSGLQLTT